MATSAISSNSTVVSCTDQRTINGTSHCTTGANSTSTSTTSITSLFERVTNFRRSLIKNQNKNKNKTRPTSGSFNFFKHSSSSSNLVESSKHASNSPDQNEANGYKPNSEAGNHSKFFVETDDQYQEMMTMMIMDTAKKNSIQVDEEDAIYGFTSLRLSNQIPTSRRQMKANPVTSSITTSGSLNTITTNSQFKAPTFTSSSCISLYETIEELEPCSDEPNVSSAVEPSNTNSSLFTQKVSKVINNRNNKYSKHLAQMQRMQAQNNKNDWKQNRRSSAIIFGTDFVDRFDSAPIPYHFGNDDHIGSCGDGSGRSYCQPQSLRRSSDDLLMISTIKQQFQEREFSDPILNSHQVNTDIIGLDKLNRIYENVGDKRCDKRKLTKDSGYESASTLVSLSQLSHNGVPSLVNDSQHNRLISPIQNAIHSRSDSIDSESSFSINGSTVVNQRKQTRTLTCTVPSVENESPPPTPPIRHSSLPEQRCLNKPQSQSNHHHRQESNGGGFDSTNELTLLWQQQQTTLFEDNSSLMVDRLASKQMQGFNNALNQPYQHHKQDSWPSFVSSSSSSSSTASLKHNRRQQLPASSQQYDSNISQSPSLSSLILSQSNQTNGRHSIASCTSSSGQQIARSHRVQQVPRQETACLPSNSSSNPVTSKPPISTKSTSSLRKFRVSVEDSIDDDEMNISAGLPPPLPPRNHQQTNSLSQIKAIQKRAVYEFYLRQKEKKKRAKCLQNADGYCSDNQANCLEPTTVMNEKAFLEENMEELPLPTPPPPLNQAEQFVYDETSDLPPPLPLSPIPGDEVLQVSLPTPPLPSPPVLGVELVTESTSSTLDPSLKDHNSLQEAQIVSKETFVFPPPPSPALLSDHTNSFQYHSQYRYFLELWPMAEFSDLLHLVINNSGQLKQPIETNLDELEEEVEEELVKIEQNRKQSQQQQTRQTILKIEQDKVESETFSNGKIYSILSEQLLLLDDSGHERNKLDLLCQDMLRIIQLLISIIQQLSQSESDNEEKQKRLSNKLTEAKQLRNGINQRRLMFEQRIKRKYGSIVITDAIGTEYQLTTMAHIYLQSNELLFLKQKLLQMLHEDLL